MKSLKTIYRRLAYSEKTHNILNNITLQIKDPDIRKQYDHERVENFDALFWPMIFVSACFFVYRVIQYVIVGT